MMKYNKELKVLVALLVALSVLVGCSDKKSEEISTIKEETVENIKNSTGSDDSKTSQEAVDVKDESTGKDESSNNAQDIQEKDSKDQDEVASQGKMVLISRHSSNDQYVYGGKDLSGTTIIPYEYADLSYVEGSHYLKGIKVDGMYLIDTATLEVEGPYTEANYYRAEAKRAFNSDIYMYYDQKRNTYGFAEDGMPVTDPKYYSASQFKNGYAVVAEGEMYASSYSVVNEDFQIILSHDMGIYNYGYGFFGLVQDFDVFAEYFNKVSLYNAQGVQLVEGLFFEVDALNENLLLVANQRKGWFIDKDGKEAKLPIVSHFKSAKVFANHILMDVGNLGDSRDVVIDHNGEIVYYEPLQDEVQDIGTAITVEPNVLVNERFTYVAVPRILKEGAEGIFEKINEVFNYYEDPTFYESMKVEDVYEEYELTYNLTRTGDVLDVALITYWYGFGAAHPNYGQETVHLDLSNGEVYTLRDLLKDDMGYVTLTQIVREMANKEAENYFSIKDIMVNEGTGFTLTNEHITFYYNPYDIAPYAAGMPEFEIPLKEIRDIIDRESSFYQSLMREVSF